MGAASQLRLGVIGDPVEHSISPAMQQPALDALGIPATYERWHTPLAELPARIESLRAADVLGANVTVPHKERILPLVDEVSSLARRAGAVNTISNRNGQLIGDNTDVYGLSRSLQLHSEILDGCQAVVLGAGGAARAVVLSLESVGAGRITVLNRTVERAERLREDLVPAPVVAIASDAAAAYEAIRSADVIINATALGWKRGELPLEVDCIAMLRATAFVVDITYRDTDLLDAARSRGLRTLDGLEMLVYQGVRSLEIWTGSTPPRRHHDDRRPCGPGCAIVTLVLIGLAVLGFLLAAALWNLSEIGLGMSSHQLRPVCVKCNTALPAITWLPLYGFFTAWRCRACATRQPRSRILWEGLVAAYFFLLGWQWDDSRQLLFAAISAVPLLLILIIDLRGNVLYINSIVLALVVAAVLGFIDGPRGMGSAMVGLIGGVSIAVAFFALSRWVFRSMNFRVSSVGIGDVYIAAAVGAIVRGDGIVPAFVIAVVLAVSASILLPILSKSARQHATAYGPFLCLGGLITLLL